MFPRKNKKQIKLIDFQKENVFNYMIIKNFLGVQVTFVTSIKNEKKKKMLNVPSSRNFQLINFKRHVRYRGSSCY